MLISIFLGPKFIEFLREREFGQQIREEGPAEHHVKQGTPTMGGLLDPRLGDRVPFLRPRPTRARGLARLRRARSAAPRSASPTTS